MKTPKFLKRYFKRIEKSWLELDDLYLEKNPVIDEIRFRYFPQTNSGIQEFTLNLSEINNGWVNNLFDHLRENEIDVRVCESYKWVEQNGEIEEKRIYALRNRPNIIVPQFRFVGKDVQMYCSNYSNESNLESSYDGDQEYLCSIVAHGSKEWTLEKINGASLILKDYCKSCF
jgi:hypothetical protein